MLGRTWGFPFESELFACAAEKNGEKAHQKKKALLQRVQEFERLRQHAIPHFLLKECPRQCPCNEFYQVDNVDEERQRDFNPLLRASDELLSSVEELRFLDKIRGLL